LKCGCIFALLMTFYCISAVSQSVPHGHLEGDSYIDPRFGLSYTFPASLQVQTSIGNMKVGTGEDQGGGSEYLFSAMEKVTGQVRSGIFILSDRIGALGIHDTRTYLRMILTKSMPPQGQIEIKPITLLGRQFFRSNAGIPGPIHSYGVQLATQCSGHFLSFWFSGSSPEKAEEIVHTLDHMQLACPSPAVK
jgi:hypothetical protein